MADAIVLSGGDTLLTSSIVRVPYAALKPFLPARRWFTKFARIVADRDVMGFHYEGLETPAEKVPAFQVRRAREIKARMPAYSIIQEARHVLKDALRFPATPEEIVLVVSAFATGRTNLGGARYEDFVERIAGVLANAADIEPFAAVSLAVACQQWNEEEKFLPEAAELLARTRSIEAAMRSVRDKLPDLIAVGFDVWNLLGELGEVSVSFDGLDDTIPPDDQKSEEAAPAALPSSPGNVMPLVLPEREAAR